MTKPERRQCPRLAVEGLAYVNLGPDNGGIVLNISEGGLCFHSTVPVDHTDTIRFWFAQRSLRPDGRLPKPNSAHSTSDTSRFIEAQSELSWTDSTKKIGGLRFTNMPPESRQQIREWIIQHATQVKMEAKSATLPPPVLKSNFVNNTLSSINTVRRGATAFPKSALNPLAPAQLNGFSGGLVAGVAVSALVAASFLLATHRSALGNSLIHLGERFGGRVISQPVSPAQQLASSPVQAVGQQVATPATAAPASAPALKKSDSTTAAQPEPIAKPHSLTPEAAIPGPSNPAPVPTRSLPTVSSVAPANGFSQPAVSASTLTPSSTPTTAPASASVDSRSALQPPATPKSEALNKSLNKPTVEIEPSRDFVASSTSEKFLDVGKFSEKLWTNKITAQLSQLGFHTTIVQKGSLWKKSFHILVGPYATDQQAEVAHKDLVARGFSPRSFERGTREFHMPLGLKSEGKFIPAGPCIVHWESYMPDAFVRFEDLRGAGVTVEGKWVRREGPGKQDAIVYQRNPDGSRTLLELHFSGKGQDLIFTR